MTSGIDTATLDQWYVIQSSDDLTPSQPRHTRLLGTPLQALRRDDSSIEAIEVSPTGDQKRALPVQERYGYVWTSLGTPAGDVFAMPEFDVWWFAASPR